MCICADFICLAIVFFKYPLSHSLFIVKCNTTSCAARMCDRIIYFFFFCVHDSSSDLAITYHILNWEKWKQIKFNPVSFNSYNSSGKIVQLCDWFTLMIVLCGLTKPTRLSLLSMVSFVIFYSHFKVYTYTRSSYVLQNIFTRT